MSTRGGRKVNRWCPEKCGYSTGYASPRKVAIMLGQHVAAKHPAPAAEPST